MSELKIGVQTERALTTDRLSVLTDGGAHGRGARFRYIGHGAGTLIYKSQLCNTEQQIIHLHHFHGE